MGAKSSAALGSSGSVRIAAAIGKSAVNALERPSWARDTRAPANPPKKDKEFKVLQRAKTLSSHRIFAPADVLAVEVFARPWKPATSTGGIAVEIGRLRTRALVS